MLYYIKYDILWYVFGKFDRSLIFHFALSLISDIVLPVRPDTGSGKSPPLVFVLSWNISAVFPNHRKGGECLQTSYICGIQATTLAKVLLQITGKLYHYTVCRADTYVALYSVHLYYNIIPKHRKITFLLTF
jgi:hypothetical protein